MKRFYLLLAVLVVIFLLTTDLILVRRVKNTQVEVQLRDSIIMHMGNSYASIDKEYMENSFSRMLLYSGQSVSDAVELIDVNQTRHTLNDVLRSGPVLVLRYGETNCLDCIVFALREMTKIANEQGIAPVVIAEYSEFHPFKNAVKTLHKGNFPFYNAPALANVDLNQAPYYFVLMPDHTMQAVFIPDKSFPQITQLYFEKIVKRYFEQYNN